MFTIQYCDLICTLISALHQIASAIKERKEAEKTHTRLLRMKEDQESFRAALQNRRREVLQVNNNNYDSITFSPCLLLHLF